MFKTMSDEQFFEYVKDFGKDLDDTIQLFFLPFEEPSLD